MLTNPRGRRRGGKVFTSSRRGKKWESTVAGSLPWFANPRGRRNPIKESWHVQQLIKQARAAKRRGAGTRARRSLSKRGAHRGMMCALGSMNPKRSPVSYRAGKAARSMYQHKARHGTAGMSMRQLRALRREMDIGVNPRRGRRNPKRARYYQGRKSTRLAWNPSRSKSRGHRGHKRKARGTQGRMRRYTAAKMRNPKRDGSMTKGEVRLQKHAEWLRTIADRGRKAMEMLKAMRTVPVASHVAIQEHAANKLSEAVIDKAMDGDPKAEAKVAAVVEHAEAKFLHQQIANLTMLINSTKDEADSLGVADEAMAEELMEQVTKMSKQRKALKDKATGLGIQTNPRRARRTVLIGTRRYASALAELKAALRSGHR